jgi:hypothetical protein
MAKRNSVALPVFYKRDEKPPDAPEATNVARFAAARSCYGFLVRS